MKLSKPTVEILKNFSTINQNLFVKAGSKLTTKPSVASIVAFAEVDETFPREFGIYNLVEFLGILSLFSDPDIEFYDNYLTVSEGKNSVQYFYASKEVLVVNDRTINLPPCPISFSLTKETFQQLMKAAAVLKVNQLVISGKDGVIHANVSDSKNSTANKYSVEVGKTEMNFEAILLIENLKLIPGDYQVGIEPKGISKFENSAARYTAYVALESSSKFN